MAARWGSRACKEDSGKPPTDSCPHQEELGERVEVAKGGLSHRLAITILVVAATIGLIPLIFVYHKIYEKYRKYR